MTTLIVFVIWVVLLWFVIKCFHNAGRRTGYNQGHYDGYNKAAKQYHDAALSAGRWARWRETGHCEFLPPLTPVTASRSTLAPPDAPDFSTS